MEKRTGWRERGKRRRIWRKGETDVERGRRRGAAAAAAVLLLIRIRPKTNKLRNTEVRVHFPGLILALKDCWGISQHALCS